jgi:hypothetical protein
MLRELISECSAIQVLECEQYSRVMARPLLSRNDEQRKKLGSSVNTENSEKASYARVRRVRIEFQF